MLLHENRNTEAIECIGDVEKIKRNETNKTKNSENNRYSKIDAERKLLFFFKIHEL